MTIFNSIFDNPKNREECKGIFFRYKFNCYVSKTKSIEYKQSFKLLKRMSCPGCNLCQGFWEDLNMTGAPEDILKLPGQLIDDQIYKICFVPVSKDWETGYLDEWYWQLLPYEIKERK